MKTQKNYHYRVNDGDSCNVRGKLSREDRMIEDHPRLMIEDMYVEEEVPVAAEPTGRMGWMAWFFAAMVALVLVGAGIYYATRGKDYSAADRQVAALRYDPSEAVAPNTSAVGALPQVAVLAEAEGISYPDAGMAENYVYYFGNDQSAVGDNAVLDRVASQVQRSGADVEVTAYASQVGSPEYNRNLSMKRAKNVANYLVAHGVPSNHVKVMASGESSSFGDADHNRRANIHVVYH